MTGFAEMHMHVNEAGYDQASRCVNDAFTGKIVMVRLFLGMQQIDDLSVVNKN
jgi:hypothetical protein